MDDLMPYRQAASSWGGKGWSVLPLPRGQKEAPDEGLTGKTGRDPTESQIELWIKTRPHDNAAVRLPEDVVGLDVDDYADKPGADTWRAHSDRYGAPPATWTTINRPAGSSGTRLYRTTCTGPFRSFLAGGGVDVIHRRHRYVMAPPSLHPSGRIYVLHDPSGAPARSVPSPLDLPWLPPAWDEALLRRRGGARSGKPQRDQKSQQPVPPPVNLDGDLIRLAEVSICSREAKAIRDAGGVSLNDLARRLHIGRSRASHLENGKLRQPRPRLLEEYGRFLSELMYLVR